MHLVTFVSIYLAIICLHRNHCHHDGDYYDDDDENLPNSGESHKAPPEGVEERPGASRVVLRRSYN